MLTPENGLSTALNARIVGSGTETIVFGHGYGTDQSIWDKVLPLLAENYRVVLFDWPFSGAVEDRSLYDPVKYSSYEAFADDLVALMAEMDLKDTTFVGHSMSGIIGCIASVKKPQLFKRLILVCASPRYLNTEGYEGGLSSSDIEQLISNMESDYEDWVSAFSSGATDPNDAISMDKFQNGLIRMGVEVAVPLAKTVFYSDYRDLLDRVEVPCSIVHTNKDMVAPPSVALYMEKKIKGKCNLEIIDIDGHFPQLNAPLKLVEVIKGD